VYNPQNTDATGGRTHLVQPCKGVSQARIYSALLLSRCALRSNEGTAGVRLPRGKPAAVADHGIIVREFDKLRKIVRTFAAGIHECLIVVGAPRTGKSEIVTRTMQEVCSQGWGLVKGKHTPLSLFGLLHRYSRYPIVLDDLDGLLAKPDNLALLKCVCETKAVKKVEWGSSHAAFQLNERGLPQKFESISRVAILCNRLPAIHADLQAVLDRGIVVYFQPSAMEIHAEVGRAGWFDDEEVYRYVGRNLHLIKNPSFIYYLKGRDLKRGSLDWQDLLLRMMMGEVDENSITVAKLLADQSFDRKRYPGKAREQAFKKSGGSRASYYRWKKKLEKQRGSSSQTDIDRMPFQPRAIDPSEATLLARRRELELEGQQALEEGIDDAGDRHSALLEAEASVQAAADPLPEQLLAAISAAAARGDLDAVTMLCDALRRITPADDSTSTRSQHFAGDVV
jgi:hypothetical protein